MLGSTKKDNMIQRTVFDNLMDFDNSATVMMRRTPRTITYCKCQEEIVKGHRYLIGSAVIVKMDECDYSIDELDDIRKEFIEIISENEWDGKDFTTSEIIDEEIYDEEIYEWWSDKEEEY